MTPNPQIQLNEFDFEYENYVMNKLDEKLHYTYSVWPSNDFKKDVKLDFYQKPVNNYRLECDLDESTSKQKFLDIYNVDIKASQWVKALDSYKQLATAILCVILIVPLASGKATVICTPIAFVTAAGMLVKPMIHTFSGSSELSALAGSDDLTNELNLKFNSCFDQGSQINFATLKNSQVKLLKVSDRMHILAILMLIVIIQVFATLTCGIILVISNKFTSSNAFENTSESIQGGICRAAADFFKYYKEFN